MHNYFIIAGDEADPASIAGSSSAAEAFASIMEAEADFVSRGDDSGTHKAELNIWQQAGLEPSGDWYISAGKVMGPCLTMAGEMQAYILTDKATWLATRDQHGLAMLVDESDDLKNTYSVIAVSSKKHPDIMRRAQRCG
jgi:tungstate transport system substrate-binding protein